jgi:hypothetical protein
MFESYLLGGLAFKPPRPSASVVVLVERGVLNVAWRWDVDGVDGRSRATHGH